MTTFVFTHSRDFGAVSLDLRIPGPGLNLDLIRSSRADGIGVLGCRWSGLDPTLILVDPDAVSSGVTGGINKLDIAPIDHVPGWQPEPGSTPQSGGPVPAATRSDGTYRETATYR